MLGFFNLLASLGNDYRCLVTLSRKGHEQSLFRLFRDGFTRHLYVKFCSLSAQNVQLEETLMPEGIEQGGRECLVVGAGIAAIGEYLR